MDLQEWSMIFLKQKDMIKREIQSMDAQEGKILIHCKNGKEKIALVKEQLDRKDIDAQADTIICLNTKENVHELHKHWETFAAQESLLIVFANPKTNEKWLLRPHLHHKVADGQSLKSGLMSMYEAITKV